MWNLNLNIKLRINMFDNKKNGTLPSLLFFFFIHSNTYFVGFVKDERVKKKVNSKTEAVK